MTESVSNKHVGDLHGKMSDPTPTSTVDRPSEHDGSPPGEDLILSKLDDFFESNGLSGFGKAMARQWITKALSGDFPPGQTSRVLRWLMQQLNGKRTCSNPWQRGCPELIPLMKTQGFWWVPDGCGYDVVRDERLSWVNALESNFEAIRAEVLALRRCVRDDGSLDGFQQYRTPNWGATGSVDSKVDGDAEGTVVVPSGPLLGHDAGDWNVYYLHLHNADYATNRARCPVTCSVLDSIPRSYEHSFFSAVAAGTHIAKHNGPTNKKLRCHLPLVVPKGGECVMRVGDQTIPFQEGKCFVFDDSFEHEVWNKTDASRIVLILDVWHPDLSDAEIKFLKFLNSGQLRLARKIGVETLGDTADDFYSVLAKAREEGGTATSVFTGVPDV